MNMSDRHVTLFPHQVEAIEKFRDQSAVLIGDSMGVGKTYTALGRDTQIRHQFGSGGQTLIICTKSMIGLWKKFCSNGVFPKSRSSL